MNLNDGPLRIFTDTKDPNANVLFSSQGNLDIFT